MNIEIGGIAYLIKTSEEWSQETLTLLRSEIAWEVNTDEAGNVTYWCMLMGDGFPVNGGERDDYTRLRVNLNDYPVKPAGKSLNSLISYINTILADIRWLKEKLAEETAARIAADEALLQNINDHKADKENPHGVTKSQVGLGNVDNTSDENKPVSTAQETRIGGVESNINDHKADKENPHGVTKSQVGLGNVDNTSDSTKPVSEPQREALDNEETARKQADDVLTGDFEDVYKLLTDTAAYMTRFVDAAGDGGNPVEANPGYERAVDKEYGMEEYREADNAGCCWDAPFASEQELDTLYDFVMSTSGADILQVDVTTDMGKKPNRRLDREYAGENGTDELRLLDLDSEYDHVEWVNL